MQKFSVARLLAAASLFPAVAVAQQSDLLVPVSAANFWPWLAVGGIVAILAVIRLAARRHSPFGDLL